MLVEEFLNEDTHYWLGLNDLSDSGNFLFIDIFFIALLFTLLLTLHSCVFLIFRHICVV